MANDNRAWTYDSVKEEVAGGKQPRDEGGEDARLNKPLPDGSYAPQFLRDTYSRADGLLHAIAEYEQDSMTALLARMRQTPFALDSVARKVSGEVEGADAEINRNLALNAADIAAREENATAATTTYSRDLQAADTSHPRGGWPDGTTTALMGAAIFFLDVIASTLWLKHALGTPKALVAGALLSFTAMFGGFLSAFFLLKPLKHTERTPKRRRLQWALAFTAGLVTFAVLYAGAVYRTSLIAGVSESDALREIGDFHKINFDAIALLVFGIAGFAYSVYKTWSFYHGHAPLLRRSGLAKAAADADLAQHANALKAHAIQTVKAAEAGLANTETANAEWAVQMAAYAEEAVGIDIEANRRLTLVYNATRAISAEYLDGYREVRPGERVVVPEPPASVAFEVPARLVKIRDESVAAARDASTIVQRGRAELAQLLERAIARIDEMAGYRARHRPVPPTLPVR